MNTFKLLIVIILTILSLNLIYSEENYTVKQFRNNPLGFSIKEGLYNVDINIKGNSRILSYYDLNSDN